MQISSFFPGCEVTNNFLNCFTGQAALMNLVEDLLELQQLLLLKNEETSSVLDGTASDWVGEITKLRNGACYWYVHIPWKLITFEWMVKCSKSEVITSLCIGIYRFCEERYDYTVLVPDCHKLAFTIGTTSLAWFESLLYLAMTEYSLGWTGRSEWKPELWILHCHSSQPTQALPWQHHYKVEQQDSTS